MPEGDTIFRAARTLHRALAGKVVTRFESVLPHLTRVDEDHPLAGRIVESVAAVGKHQLMRFSGDLVLRTHMRMNGSWHLYRPGEKWQRPRAAMRLLVETADFVAVGFDVPDAELIAARDLDRHAELRRLGPDVLGVFDAGEAERRIRARADTPIGEVLLNQRVLAGIGNVFKCEILFLAGVHPSRPAGTLSDRELRAIVELSQKLLAANVAEGAGGGIVTWFGHRRTTGRTHPHESLWVYGRSGEPCRRCRTPIAFARHGVDARVTYWCPACQARSGVKYGDAPLVEHTVRALIASGLLVAASTASAARIEGNGQATTQIREVGEFTGLKLETSADVVVKVGGERRVTVTADSNLLEHVRTDVRGRSLVIDTENGLRPKTPLRVEISVPELREVEIDGSGTVAVEGARGDAALSIDGSGDLRWSGEGGDVRVEIEGSGTTTLAGSANQLAIEVSGSGDVDAAALRARNASVEVEGSGDVNVHVDGGAFRAEVTGSGDVTWSGNGTVERATVSGSGEIRKR